MKLSVCGIWPGLPQGIASELLAEATSHRLKVGDPLFEAGDEGDGCYKLDKGAQGQLGVAPGRIIAILPESSVVGDLAHVGVTAKVGVSYGSDRLRAQLCQPSKFPTRNELA